MMNGSRVILLIILFSLTVNVNFIFSSDNTVRGATTIVVAKSGGDYDNLGDAVNNSNNGDTIYIQAGTYYHFDAGGPITVTKNITIYGENANTTIIKSNISAKILQVDATTFTMYELNFTKATGASLYAINLGEELDTVEIYDCNISSNLGIRANNITGDILIHNCYFRYTDAINTGIYIDHNYEPIGGNFYCHNSTFDNKGISILDSSPRNWYGNVTIENCSFNDTALNAFQCQRVILQDNIFYGERGAGDQFSTLSHCENVTIQNNFCYGGDYGVHTGNCSYVEINNNYLDDFGIRGIWLYPLDSTTGKWFNVTGNIVNNSDSALLVCSGLSNVTIKDNYLLNSSDTCLELKYVNWDWDNVSIYNNYFQGSDIQSEVFSDLTLQIFNISKTGGLNIVGGMYLGGNYWWNYTGIDADGDGIGDTNYSINNSGLFDELPLVNSSFSFGPPTDIIGTIESGINLNISWTKNGSADTTLIRSNLGSYPTSVTDGTLEYNNTGSYYVDSWVVNTYYTLWSYNSTINDYSIPAYLILGSITVNAYNESNPSQDIVNYSITVSDDGGSVVGFYEDCTNAYVIDLADFNGDGYHYFKIEHENYSSRTYYSYINLTNSYFLDAFLPPLSANLYYIKVIDSYIQPINDANVVITRSLSGTVYEMSSGHTDYYGMYPVYLIPEKSYLINISKDGYTSIVNDDLFPDPVYYGYDYPIVYQLDLNLSSPEYDLFFTDVLFNAEMISAGYMQLGNITVNYTDSNSSTVDTTNYIYELYGGSATLINITTDTSQTWDIKVGGINTTRDHVVVLWFNNTADYSDVTSPATIYLSALHIYCGDRECFNFSERITNIFGPATINNVDIGWHNIVSVIIAVIILCLLGPYDTGIGIIGAGLGIGFMDAIFQLWFCDDFPYLLLTLAPLFVIIGILYLWAKHKGVEGI